MMVLAFCGCNSNRASEEQLRSEISRIPMLYTVEAEVEVLVEGHGENGTAEWKAMFGTRDIILPVRANVKAGIDLSKITQLEIDGDRVGRRILSGKSKNGISWSPPRNMRNR